MNRQAQQALHEKATAKAAPAIRRGFLASVDRLRAAIDRAALRDALARNDRNAALALIDAALVAEPWRPLGLAMTRSIAGAGDLFGDAIAAEVVRKREARAWGFNVFSPTVASAVRGWVAPLLDRLSQGVRTVAFTVLLRAQAENLSPADTAREVAETIGLTERQVLASQGIRTAAQAERERAMAQAAGDEAAVRQARRRREPSREQVEAKVAAYRKRALAERGRLFGLNEARRAAAIATQAAWEQAAADGLIDAATTIKRWNHLADGRVRDAHISIPVLNPEGVPLLSPFTSTLGPIRHPHDEAALAGNVIGCRCFLSYRVGLTG